MSISRTKRRQLYRRSIFLLAAAAVVLVFFVQKSHTSSRSSYRQNVELAPDAIRLDVSASDDMPERQSRIHVPQERPAHLLDDREQQQQPLVLVPDQEAPSLPVVADRDGLQSLAGERDAPGDAVEQSQERDRPGLGMSINEGGGEGTPEDASSPEEDSEEDSEVARTHDSNKSEKPRRKPSKATIELFKLRKKMKEMKASLANEKKDLQCPAPPRMPGGKLEVAEWAGGEAAVRADPACQGFPNVSNIAVIVKTGASEIYSKLPTQLLTAVRCIPDLLVFSDRDDVVAGIPVYNAMDKLLPEAMDAPEFDLYRAQINCVTDQEHCTKDVPDKAKMGWTLDKYKNIHMAEKTWKLMPDKDWYLFIDADTYVFWNTLVLWLRQMDPSRKHYLGSTYYYAGEGFAQGGSGYVVSRAAMKALYSKPGVANQYDMQMRDVCCGDHMFGKALREQIDLLPSNAVGTITGESVWNFLYWKNNWCTPLATVHHMSAEEVSQLWGWEARHYAADAGRWAEAPVLTRDLYRAFFRMHVSPTPAQQQRPDWHNRAREHVFGEPGGGKGADWSDAERAAFKSAEDCRLLCETTEKCVSWVHEGTECGISTGFGLGYPAQGPVSGWMAERIRSIFGDIECSDNVGWKLFDGDA